jgi:hypothetical protein
MSTREVIGVSLSGSLVDTDIRPFAGQSCEEVGNAAERARRG